MRDEGEPRMKNIARELRAPVPVSESFDARVMDAVRSMPRYGRLGLWSRLTTPRRRSFTVTPLTLGLIAAWISVFALLGAAHGSAQDQHGNDGQPRSAPLGHDGCIGSRALERESPPPAVLALRDAHRD